MFDSYSQLADVVTRHVRTSVPKDPRDSDFVYRQATRAKALDAVRGALPAASLSNVGIYGTGQAFEALLLRMRAHALPEARVYADMMLTELRKVVPSFLKRVDIPERGGAWSEYLADTRESTHSVVERILGDDIASEVDEVTLTDFDPDLRSCRASMSCRPNNVETFFGRMSAIVRIGVIDLAVHSSGRIIDSMFSLTTEPSVIFNATGCSPLNGNR
jgi:thymidylate synthase ThyX